MPTLPLVVSTCTVDTSAPVIFVLGISAAVTAVPGYSTPGYSGYFSAPFLLLLNSVQLMSAWWLKRCWGVPIATKLILNAGTAK